MVDYWDLDLSSLSGCSRSDFLFDDDHDRRHDSTEYHSHACTRDSVGLVVVLEITRFYRNNDQDAKNLTIKPQF